jgi:glycosyltransferase involved in cell wall biosynthesis
MRIFITADPELPVPPRFYGGIERVIAELADGLVERGHDVTLVAHADSKTRAALVPYPASRSGSRSDTVKNAAAIAGAYRTRRPDIVHSFSRLAYLTPLLALSVPKVMSYQRPVTRSRVLWAHTLSRGTLRFTGCSRRLIASVQDVGVWQVVHNCVPVDRFRFSAAVPGDAPLMFLGRIEAIKGTHLAIDAARSVGRRLVIAGTVATEHRDYFETEVEPHVDGQSITYVGPVDDAAKADLLAGAAALLMPVLWDEPFGIVMAEALACGTPVIGLDRGAVPEVIDDGTTGFVCQTVEQMAAAIGRVGAIERSACRRAAVERFSSAAVVSAYETVYASAAAPPQWSGDETSAGRPVANG